MTPDRQQRRQLLHNGAVTIRQRLLFAALRLRQPFEVHDLVVAAWRLYPATFGLLNHQHPDSHRVWAKLSGAGGLRAFGWVERLAPGRYQVTAAGRRIARGLGGDR